MNSPLKTPSFLISTIGCKVNQYESESMRNSLIQNGFSESDSDHADFYIINSCTVTHKADRDARRLIRHFMQLNPKAKVIVSGCYAEREEDREILSQIEGVSYLIRNKEKEKIGEILRKAYGAPRLCSGLPLVVRRMAYGEATGLKGRDRAFVKIQDGCNYKCSYCKVALVRGKSVSRSEKSILDEIKKIIESGCKEIVLTGICLGAWGMDFEKKSSLDYLLERICGLGDSFRIRLSSIEPAYVTDELIKKLAQSEKICKHLHIPLQSGDDKILKLMNRTYTAKTFLALIKKIRKKIPDIAFTTDIMVGFPTEDMRGFKNTYSLVRKTRPSRIHIFPYSKRPGTSSSQFKDLIPMQEIKRRKCLLKNLADELSLKFAKKFLNKNVNVLIESKQDKKTGLLTGYTDNYIKLLIEESGPLVTRITPVRIKTISKTGIFATPARP